MVGCPAASRILAHRELGSRGPGFSSVTHPSPCRISEGMPGVQVGCKDARDGPSVRVSGCPGR